MRPSEIRRTILEDHAALRGQFAALRDLLRQARSAGRDADVRELGAALRQRFLAHLDLEERHLVPALRQVDAWGAERARRVLQEHAEQRARFDQILEHLRDPRHSAEKLVSELSALLRDLLEDMAHEESSVLNENLLRDDPVVISPEPE